MRTAHQQHTEYDDGARPVGEHHHAPAADAIVDHPGGGSHEELRQNLQHEYLSRLINITRNTAFFAPARGVALHELRRIDAMFQMAQVNAPEANKPHIEYVLFRIKQALEPRAS